MLTSSQLREFAVVLYNMVIINAPDKEISDEIEKYMCVIYRIVGICLDIPNDTFKWHCRVNNDQSLSYENITPLEFYETLVRPTFNVDDKVGYTILKFNKQTIVYFKIYIYQVSLICDPRPKNKFGKLYTFDLIGNVKEGSKILYNNQPIEILLEACKQSINKLKEPVWYSCEVDKKFASDLGSEDLQMYVLVVLQRVCIDFRYEKQNLFYNFVIITQTRFRIVIRY